MFAVALIFFREVLEAALVIGVLAAATAGLPGRTRWLVAGVLAGLGGALVAAAFAEQLASAAEGVGQELFNAGVLFAAVLMLSWHTVWMARHGRDLAHQATILGESVASGTRPMVALAVAVGLAVLREGAEIVLFLSGLMAGGTTSAGHVSVGAATGLCTGIAVGYAVFRGLRMVPTRRLFTATSILIALLAAGMAARGIAFLNQAGYLSSWTEIVWDSSSLIADASPLGQALSALVGYIAAPMESQVIAYALTIGVLLLASLWMGRGDTSAHRRATGVPLALMLLIGGSLAGMRDAQAGFKVYSPYVEQGEWELEFRGHRSVDADPGKDDGRSFLYEIGYSPTPRWHTAVFLEAEGEPGESNTLTEFAWENIVQLTEPGQYWLDVGAYVEYAKGLTHEGDHALEWKILLEKDFDKFVVVANPIFEQGFSDSADSGVEFEYAWGTYYRLNPAFEPGFEAYGGIGELTDANDLNAQEHFIGPAARGTVLLGGGSKLKYNLGYLLGVTDETPDGAFKFELEYEFRF
jgi:high-affinity iron transporter